MSKDEKKEILLKILESLFEDRTREVNSSNCISFYHFLLSTLELEIFELPAEEDATISICYSIIEFLSNFDLIEIEPDHWDSTNTKKYIKGYSGTNEEEYQDSISKIRKAYVLIKDSYFLNLP